MKHSYKIILSLGAVICPIARACGLNWVDSTLIVIGIFFLISEAVKEGE